MMTSTSTIKTVRFSDDVTIMRDSSTSCRHTWYEMWRLYDAFLADVEAANRRGIACPRGLESAQAKHVSELKYAQSVVRMHRLLKQGSRIANCFGMKKSGPEKRLAKYAQKRSSENQAKALEVAKHDEEEANKVHMCVEDVSFYYVGEKLLGNRVAVATKRSPLAPRKRKSPAAAA